MADHHTGVLSDHDTRNNTAVTMNLFRGLFLVSLYYHQTTSQAQPPGVQGYDCSDIWGKNIITSGIYTIKPQNSPSSFSVFCEMTENGGWTLIQKHDGADGLDFEQDWTAYENGFGNIQGEHWLGLEKIYALTQQTNRPSKLHISLAAFDGGAAYTEYSPFSIGNAGTSYKLSAGNYVGTAGDAFLGVATIIGSNQHSNSFSTWDHATDNCHPNCLSGDTLYLSCSSRFRAGWWFNSCGTANLNGVWRKPPTYKNWATSVSWPTWKPNESLKFSKMYLIHG
ncbi:fibrinogen-like protein 1 [Rhinoderma darwinii]|uniref:fibrinogen-like protein 1 n=1 Tax=Rhinoderma darwinii TaxID=43563 RepID=UPI003F67D1C6